MRYAVINVIRCALQRWLSQMACSITLSCASVITCSLMLSITCTSTTARAQSCHQSAMSVIVPAQAGSSPSPPIGIFQIGIGSEFATYRNARFEGEYQGLNVAARWDHRWLQLRTALPSYRIVRNGLASYGLGDLFIDLRVPLLHMRNDTFTSGVGVATTAPTGNAALDLGMGHWMVMPGVWTRWQGHHAFFTAQLAYGRAIVNHHTGHHHGGGPASIPNPMNLSEIEASAAAGYTFFSLLRVRAGTYGAVPIATQQGASRMAALAGIDILFKWIQISAEQHLPLIGDPFRAKTAIALSTAF